MQVVFRNNLPTTLYADFRDANNQSVPASGSITVTIQYQDGTTRINATPAKYNNTGIYSYVISPDSSWHYGYYAAWWRDANTGTSITQDIPNVFKLEDPVDTISKAVMYEHVRSSLYMHSDMGGFVDKFPRDREILDYLEQSLSWWNGHPPLLTFYTFYDILQSPWTNLVERGAVIFALQALGILESGKHFVYNDNGISLTRDRSGKYQQWYTTLLQQYAADLKTARMKVGLSSVVPKGSFSSTTGFPRSLSRALRGVSKFS